MTLLHSSGRGLAALAVVLVLGMMGPSAANDQLAEATGLAKKATLIARIWHGRTPAAKAEEYTTYLYEAGIKKIESIPGNRGAQMLRKVDGEIADFTVISYWDSVDAIKKFAGEDYEQTHNLPKDPEYLINMEPKVRHLEVMVKDWQMK